MLQLVEGQDLTGGHAATGPQLDCQEHADDSWECGECGVFNEGDAAQCSFCGEPRVRNSVEAESDGVEDDAEQMPIDEDAARYSQVRFSVIGEDELKYFDAEACEPFATPLPKLVAEELPDTVGG